MNLPQGWTIENFSTVVEIHDNLRKPINNAERELRINGKQADKLYPYYGATGQIGYIDDYITDGEYVLLGEDGAPFLNPYTNKAYIINGKTWVNNHAHVLRSKCNNKFLFYYLNYFTYNGYVTGTTRLKLTQSDMKRIPVINPPLPEQHRIVAKIDSLFSELDNGVTLLKTIKAQLAVYRQAVLKWAFDGKLTNNDWKMGILEDIVSEIKIGPFGTLLHKADYIENGIPIINPKHMNNQKIKYDSHTTISKQKAKDLSSYKLQENDIILARRGEMGRTVPVTEKEVGWLCGTGSMIVRLKTGNLNNLYSLFLSSERVRKYLTENCKGTTMNNLNEAIVKKIPVPICSHPEQIAIISAIESRLSVCDKLEQTIDQTLALSASLRQSVLKKAFEGRLVPQDPNDEPAEKLLERIRAQKAAELAKQKQTRKRGRK